MTLHKPAGWRAVLRLRLLRALRQYEWLHDVCPLCGNTRSQGHDLYCQIDKLVYAIEQETS